MSLTKKNTTRILPVCFFLPFLLSGSYFSTIAVAYIDALPDRLYLPGDYAYGIFLAFADMGLASGIVLLCLASMILKLGSWLSGLRWFKKAKVQTVSTA